MAIKKTVSYEYTGASQDVPIPEDCGNLLNVDVRGAGGPFSGDGGGGRIVADMPITEDQRDILTLRLRLGGVGHSPVGAVGGAGGFNGGGAGRAAATTAGYGGSGGSDIRIPASNDTVAGRIIVAGGAGATGRNSTTGTKGAGGGGGGTSGAAGGNATSSGGHGGGAGTQSAGGAGGAPGGGAGDNAGAGALGQGGVGSTHSTSGIVAGGGGGGGYEGGGGGGGGGTGLASGGGGGGSSHYDPTIFLTPTVNATSPARQGLAGEVIFSWWPVPQAPTLIDITAVDPEALVTPMVWNYCWNPGVEEVIQGYSGIGIATDPTQYLVPHSGTYAAITTIGSDIPLSQGMGCPAAQLEIGETYTVSAWVYVGTGTHAQLVISDIYGTHLGFSSEVSTLANVWERLSVTFQLTSVALGYMWPQVLITDDFSVTPPTQTYLLVDDCLYTKSSELLDDFNGDDDGYAWASDPGVSPSYKQPIINPDFDIRLTWQYASETTNFSDHWKSYLDYNNDGGSSWSPMDVMDSEVAIQTVAYQHNISVTIPKGNFQPDLDYFLRIRDMDVLTEMWGLGTVVQFSTPARPETPVWVSPAPDELKANYTVNPNFEYGILGWTHSAVATLSQDATKFHEGVHSLKLTQNTTGAAAILSQVITVDPDAEDPITAMSASCWINVPAGTFASFAALIFYFYNDVGTLLGYGIVGSTAIPANIGTNGQWLFVKTENNPVPAGTTSIYLGINNGQSMNAGSTINIDQVMINGGSTVQDYFDGDTPNDHTHYYTWIGPAGDAVTFLQQMSELDTLPARASWTADSQLRWRVAQYAVEDTLYATPLWDSGWHDSSVRAGIIEPEVKGTITYLALYIHNGIISSDPAVILIYIPTVTELNDALVQRQKIEIEVYNGLTGEFISNVPNRSAPTFLEELRGPGAGSFTIRLDDPSWTAHPTLINARNIVRVKDHGKYIGFWIITSHNATSIATDEGSAEAITVSGIGGYGIWPTDAVVYPERGTQDFAGNPVVVRASRSFGVASDPSFGAWYDSSTWIPAVQMIQQNSTTAVPAPNLPVAGNPWKGGPSDWPVDLGTAWWIWSEEARQVGPAGVSIFKCTLSNTQTFPIAVQLFLAADDECQAYLDGDPWVYSNNWRATTQSDITWISPGIHQLTFVAAQAQYTDADFYSNPAGIVFGMYSFAGAGGTDDAHGVTLISSAASVIANGYPGVIPSWTVGDVLQTLASEAIFRAHGANNGRGQTTSFDRFHLGFDEIYDSYGEKWARDGSQWFFDIGLSYDQVIDKLTDTTCDIWFDQDLVLQSARTRGVDRGQVDPPATYQDLIKIAAPRYYWDFADAPVDGTYPLIDEPMNYFVSVDGEGFCYDSDNFVFTSANWIWGTFSAGLNTPAEALQGLKTTGAGDPLGDITLFALEGILDPTKPIYLPVEAEDGVTFEFLCSNGYLGLDMVFLDEGTDSSLNGLTAGLGNVPIDIAAYLDDYTDTQFDASILNFSVEAYSNQAHVILREDEYTHHMAYCVYNGATNSTIVIYRDGVEILSAQFSIPFNIGQIGAQVEFFPGTTTTKLHAAVGHFAIYDRILSEDEIYSHYQGFQDDALKHIDPVIFKKAKNVLTASSQIDYAAKTMLLSRSANAMAEIQAPPSILNKYGRIEGFYDGSDKTTSDVRRIATSTLQSSIATQPNATMDFWGTYTPWQDYGVGDWILAPGDLGEELVRRRVMSLSISEDEDTGESIYAQEIDSLNQEEGRRLALWITRTLPQGNLSGLISD